MKLLNLKLRNFQGGNDILDPMGQSCNVFGDNGTGKTRLASTFSYLLFGEDSQSRTSFEILPLLADGQRDKSITEAEVEATLSYGLADAQQVTLKRNYVERWGKRGEQKGKLLGHRNAGRANLPL